MWIIIKQALSTHIVHILQTIQSFSIHFQVSLQTGQVHFYLPTVISFFLTKVFLFLCFDYLFWFQFWIFLFRYKLIFVSFGFLLLVLLLFSFIWWTGNDFRFFFTSICKINYFRYYKSFSKETLLCSIDLLTTFGELIILTSK